MEKETGSSVPSNRQQSKGSKTHKKRVYIVEKTIIKLKPLDHMQSNLYQKLYGNVVFSILPPRSKGAEENASMLLLSLDLENLILDYI